MKQIKANFLYCLLGNKNIDGELNAVMVSTEIVGLRVRHVFRTCLT